MERDQYWPCDEATGACEESPTVNSAPIWSVDHLAWEKAGGKTIATADAPLDPKFGGEPTTTTRTTIGVLELGKGRIVLFGALLRARARRAHRDAHRQRRGDRPHPVGSRFS